MINPILLKEINQKIDETNYFSVADFSILNPNSKDNDSVIIKYLYRPEFYFSCTIPNSLSYKKDEMYGGSTSYYEVRTKMCPGEFSSEFNINYSSKNELINAISNWLKLIIEILNNEPINRLVEKLKKQVNDLEDKLKDVPTEEFEEKEKESLKEKLVELQNQFENSFKKIINDKDELNKELNVLKNEFNALKVNLENMNKQHWFKFFINKFYKWSSNPKNQKAIADVTKSVQDMLPDVVDNIKNIQL